MINIKRRVLVGLIIVLWAWPAHAISIDPPRPFTLLSDDKAYIFVSLPPDYSDDRPESDEHKAIRKNYKVGGVYRNDSSREPLWEYREELYAEVVYFDDRSLVLASDPHERAGSALLFYDKGREIRRYKLKQLTYDDAYLDRLDGTYDAAVYSIRESWYASMTVKDGILRIVNREQNVLLFDVRTGERHHFQEATQSCLWWFKRLFGQTGDDLSR